MTARVLPSAMPRTLHVAKLATSDYDDDGAEGRTATASLDEATVVSSISTTAAVPDSLEDLFGPPAPATDFPHFPVLDLDVPAHLVPSSTPGHSHLYLDVPMTGEQLWRLCDVLVEVGVLERGYVDACRSRGYTSVRLPWIRKADVVEAAS